MKVTEQSGGRSFVLERGDHFTSLFVETTDGSFQLPMDIEELEALQLVITEYLRLARGEVPDQLALLMEKHGSLPAKALAQWWINAEPVQQTTED